MHRQNLSFLLKVVKSSVLSLETKPPCNTNFRHRFTKMSDETVQNTVESEENPQIESNGETKPTEAGVNTTVTAAASKSDENSDKPSEAGQKSIEYEKYISYDDDGTAIYTDPATNYKYTFDKEKNQWVPKDGQDAATDDSGVYENEHYRWCTEKNQWVLKDEALAAAASAAGSGDPSALENEHYKWNAETNAWEPKSDDTRFATSVYKDGQHLYTDPDGAIYFWDEEKKAWFPKIDDDFLAIYQTNYGFIDNTSPTTAPTAATTAAAEEAASSAVTDSQHVAQNDSTTNSDRASDEPQKPSGKRKAPPPQWFEEEPEKCTKVYVSNLPDTITEEEFTEVMSKCGMILRDPKTRKTKIKLYAEPSGQLKGDGLVNYIRVESVQLAIDMLDGYEIKGHKIKVQRAQFQMRGEYNPKLKPKRNKQDKEKMKKMKDKLLAWHPDKMRGERGKNERVVIIKNLFEPSTFDNQVDLIIDYQNNVRDECVKCGTVKKVIVYSCEPDGICEVRMSDPEEADLVVQMMDRRYFGKRMLSAAIWDGKTKYKLKETDAEAKDRLSKWDEFLEQDDDDDDKKPAVVGATDVPAAPTGAAVATNVDSSAAVSAENPSESNIKEITTATTGEAEIEQTD